MFWRRLTVFSTASLLTLAVPKSRAADAPAAPVTFEQAYQAALAKTETVEIQRTRQSQTEARVDQAKGALFPEISANANYAFQDVAEGTGSNSNRADSSATRLTLAQPLYSGGRDRAAYAAAKSTLAAQEQTVAATRAELLSTVAAAYYELQAAEQDLSHLRTSLRLTQDRVNELQKRVKIGRSRTGEVLTAQSAFAVVQSQVEQGEARVRIARDRFSFITGLERETMISPLTEQPRKPDPLTNYLKLVEERPDIKSLREQKAAQAASVEVAQGEHLPTLSLTGNYYLFRNPRSAGGDWDVGVGLTVPIYEGGTVQAKVREAKAKETESELQLRQATRQAETEIRTAYSSLQSAVELLSSLEKAVVASERAYREQARDYQYGLVTNLDVLQALNTLQDAKRSLDRARVQASLSWADLDAAIAKIPTGGPK